MHRGSKDSAASNNFLTFSNRFIMTAIRINKQDVQEIYALLDGSETQTYNVCQSTSDHYNYRPAGMWSDEHLKHFVERSFQPPACRAYIKCSSFSRVQTEAQRRLDLTLQEFLKLVYDLKVKDGKFPAAGDFVFDKNREKIFNSCI